ncbi:ThiF family adenylyltransferase [bacterium]|nr:ThiF family adenylyltransferase [bacterium]
MHTLSQMELLRYQRHFPVIGLAGQQQLKQAKILSVGGGGLACPALQYLAAAGIGTLGIVDGDHVELSNLQRQILFQELDIGQNKAEIIAKRLRVLNSQLNVDVYPEFLTDSNAKKIIQNYDVILDATDNYPARYLLNEMTRALKKPLVSASIYQFDAQISVFNHQNGPCYQCLYPEPPPASLIPNCAMGGVLGILPGVAGTIQATEAIKIILGIGENLSGTLLCMDLLSMQFKHFEINKSCDNHPKISFATQEAASTFSVINAVELSELLATNTETIQLIDVRQPYERDICHIGGELIPVAELALHIDRLDKTKLTVVYCKSGGRSASACHQLKAAGFTEVMNLNKGILGWIDSVDDSLMRY